MLDSWYFTPSYYVLPSGSCSLIKITCGWNLLCLNCSVEGVGYGKQESCVQDKLFTRLSSVLGEFGNVCVVILPGTVALCSCKSIRPQAEIQRSSLKEPAGHISHGWSMAEWGRGRKSLCVCTDPVRGLLQVPRFVVGPRAPQAPCTLAEHHVETPSASQEWCGESCLLFLSY